MGEEYTHSQSQRESTDVVNAETPSPDTQLNIEVRHHCPNNPTRAKNTDNKSQTHQTQSIHTSKMKYTVSLTVTLLCFLDLTSSAPLAPRAETAAAYLSRAGLTPPPTLPHAVPLESRSNSQTDKRDKSYGFGDPTHFAVLVDPVSRPNPCGTGCTQQLKVRDLSEEEQEVKKQVRKRSVENGGFITNVEFKSE